MLRIFRPVLYFMLKLAITNDCKHSFHLIGVKSRKYPGRLLTTYWMAFTRINTAIAEFVPRLIFG